MLCSNQLSYVAKWRALFASRGCVSTLLTRFFCLLFQMLMLPPQQQVVRCCSISFRREVGACQASLLSSVAICCPLSGGLQGFPTRRLANYPLIGLIQPGSLNPSPIRHPLGMRFAIVGVRGETVRQLAQVSEARARGG